MRMKFQFILFAILVWTYSNAQTTLYININAHNEETDFEGLGGTSSGIENSQYGYNNDALLYKTYRDYVKQIADTIVSKKAKWNFQSDWTFLEGCLNYDSGSTTLNTSGLSIVKWLQDSTNGRVELDPHFHGNTHNIADVAWLYKLNGIEPSLNVGGFIYNAVSGNMKGDDWRDLKNGIETEYYDFNITNYTYTPEVLWGAAAANHIDDVRDYGAWKPIYMDFVLPIDSFYVHDISQSLLFIGNGCAGGNDSSSHMISTIGNSAEKIVDDLTSFAEKINNGTYPSGKFYTASIQMKQSEYNQDYIKELSKLIDSLNSYIMLHPGKMEWALLSEKKQIWNVVYNENENQRSCDGSQISTIVNEPLFDNSLTIFPNPSEGKFTIPVPITNNANFVIQMDDLLGKKIDFNYSKEDHSLDMSGSPNGVYLCRIFIEGTLVVSQLVIKNF